MIVKTSSINDLVRELYFADLAAGRNREQDEWLELFPDHAPAVLALLEDLEQVGREIAAETESEPHPPLACAPSGRPFGPYVLQQLVDRGGQGKVWRAVDRRLGRAVALKTLHGAAVAPSARRRLEREAVALSRLDHPNICAIYETGEVEGEPFIAMRFVEGTTLAEIISKGPSTDDESSGPADVPRLVARPSRVRDVMDAVRLTGLCARALHAAHELGVLHRDVTPGNIAVAANGTPVLLDFGLAALADAEGLTHPEDVMGTPAYMAPEQIASNATVDERTDVYGLGAVLYELLTGVPPFGRDTREKLFARILGGGPAALRAQNAAVPRDLETVVLRALEANPERRYESALAFALDLERVYRFLPIAARRTGPLERSAKFVRRNPAISGLLAVALVLATWSLLQNGTLNERNRELGARSRELVQQSLLVKAQNDHIAIEENRSRTLQAPYVLDALRRESAAFRLDDPEQLPAIESWLRTAADLAADRNRFERALADLAGGDAERTRQLVTDIEVFMAPTNGELERVRGLAEKLRDLGRRSLRDPAAAWEAARAYAAREAPYRGLELEPAMGLVPLGADPSSGLLEFVHVPSGATPERDATGRLAITGDTGLVLVLLPGGAFRMGATRSADGGTSDNVDPFAERQDGPVHEVVLAPFFLSKYEVTQAQWLRIAGENPSAQPAGREIGGVTVTDVHPVENVSWTTCRDVLGSAGLDLPTEAQWEYAARAGTSTIWWSGSARDDLIGCANLADQTAKKAGATWSAIDDWPELDDGWVTHAPVDTLRPNPFGLHHVHGNVWEWCRDGVGTYRTPPRGDEGERPTLEGTLRVYRGGAFSAPAYLARSAHRSFFTPETTLGNLGVRPMRRLK